MENLLGSSSAARLYQAQSSTLIRLIATPVKMEMLTALTLQQERGCSRGAVSDLTTLSVWKSRLLLLIYCCTSGTQIKHHKEYLGNRLPFHQSSTETNSLLIEEPGPSLEQAYIQGLNWDL